MEHLDVIARELDLPAPKVQAVLELIAQGGTVPFIARYRKERTGSMDEVKIRAIQERAEYLDELAARKKTVLATIGEQGKLTDDLKARIERVWSKAELED